MNAPSSSTIRSFFLHGPAGRLEALLNAGAADATHAALVCHPHPSFGGTLHNRVVFHAMKALNTFGFPVLRFNFRSAGLSQGEHDHGRGEVDDVRTALDWLDKEFRLPLIFAGFSFGAAVGLQAACPDTRVKATIALGTPVAAMGAAPTRIKPPARSLTGGTLPRTSARATAWGYILAKTGMAAEAEIQILARRFLRWPTVELFLPRTAVGYGETWS